MTTAAPEAPAAPAPQTPATPAAPAPTPAPQGPAQPATPAAVEVQSDDDAARLAARYSTDQLAAYALSLRKEAGDHRQAKLTAEQEATAAADKARNEVLEQLKPALVAAGLLKDDKADTDPQKIAEGLAAKQLQDKEQEKQTRTLLISNAVLRKAPAEGVNGDAILNWAPFTNAAAALDPSAADFEAKLIAAMKEAADKADFLKVARVAARGGVQMSGGSGERTQNTAPKSLDDAVAGYYGN